MFLFGRRNCAISKDALKQKIPVLILTQSSLAIYRQPLSLPEPHSPYLYHKGKVSLLREAGVMKVF